MKSSLISYEKDGMIGGIVYNGCTCLSVYLLRKISSHSPQNGSDRQFSAVVLLSRRVHSTSS